PPAGRLPDRSPAVGVQAFPRARRATGSHLIGGLTRPARPSNRCPGFRAGTVAPRLLLQRKGKPMRPALWRCVVLSDGTAMAAQDVESLGRSACDQYLAPRARVQAIDSLGALEAGAANALPALVDCLSDKNDEVASHAAAALGRVGDVEALPALVDLQE